MSRRFYRISALFIAILLVASYAGTKTRAAAPIVLQVVDVGGQLRLVRGMIDNYVKANPDKVSKVEYITDTAPNLPGRIKAQIDGGKIDTTLALGGYDAVSTGLDAGIWAQILPGSADKFPKLDDNYQPGAKAYNDLAKGYAICTVYSPSGPMIEYDPSQVENPPKTIDDLKAWIKANPNKFFYARPANSGPGRSFLMGLPYLLGDKDPKDPVNGWEKTWAFLKEIDASIEYYPSRTGDVMTEMGNGTRAMTPVQIGWYIYPRATGTVPPEYKATVLQNTTWVADAQFAMIPKGLDADRQAIALDLIAWMLKPEQQAIAYDEGYFYPGPAVKNVPLSLAPAASQKVVNDFGMPGFDDMLKDVKPVLPLDPAGLVAAFNKWDKEIGQNKVKAAPTAVPPTATAAK